MINEGIAYAVENKKNDYKKNDVNQSLYTTFVESCDQDRIYF